MGEVSNRVVGLLMCGMFTFQLVEHFRNIDSFDDHLVVWDRRANGTPLLGGLMGRIVDCADLQIPAVKNHQRLCDLGILEPFGFGLFPMIAVRNGERISKVAEPFFVDLRDPTHGFHEINDGGKCQKVLGRWHLGRTVSAKMRMSSGCTGRYKNRR